MKQLFKGSSLLNILGMTAAFAALYIILVQVHYDLTYNRSIPDSERVYLMTLPLFGQDKNNAYINRPMAEEIIADIPCVEAYGIAQLNEHTQTETPVHRSSGKWDQQEKDGGSCGAYSCRWEARCQPFFQGNTRYPYPIQPSAPFRHTSQRMRGQRRSLCCCPQSG